jgi:predicted nuclease with TOPRIM domain
MDRKTSYPKINRQRISIMSLRNKLNNTVHIEEFGKIAAEIINLEQQIAEEKKKECIDISQEKEQIQAKIDKMNNQIKILNNQLSHLEQKLYVKGQKQPLENIKKTSEVVENEFNRVFKKITGKKIE